jgi:hypothetical protein
LSAKSCNVPTDQGIKQIDCLTIDFSDMSVRGNAKLNPLDGTEHHPSAELPGEASMTPSAVAIHPVAQVETCVAVVDDDVSRDVSPVTDLESLAVAEPIADLSLENVLSSSIFPYAPPTLDAPSGKREAQHSGQVQASNTESGPLDDGIDVHTVSSISSSSSSSIIGFATTELVPNSPKADETPRTAPVGSFETAKGKSMDQTRSSIAVPVVPLVQANDGSLSDPKSSLPPTAVELNGEHVLHDPNSDFTNMEEETSSTVTPSYAPNDPVAVYSVSSNVMRDSRETHTDAITCPDLCDTLQDQKARLSRKSNGSEEQQLIQAMEYGEMMLEKDPLGRGTLEHPNLSSDDLAALGSVSYPEIELLELPAVRDLAIDDDCSGPITSGVYSDSTPHDDDDTDRESPFMDVPEEFLVTERPTLPLMATVGDGSPKKSVRLESVPKILTASRHVGDADEASSIARDHSSSNISDAFSSVRPEQSTLTMLQRPGRSGRNVNFSRINGQYGFRDLSQACSSEIRSSGTTHVPTVGRRTTSREQTGAGQDGNERMIVKDVNMAIVAQLPKLVGSSRIRKVEEIPLNQNGHQPPEFREKKKRDSRTRLACQPSTAKDSETVVLSASTKDVGVSTASNADDLVSFVEGSPRESKSGPRAEVHLSDALSENVVVPPQSKSPDQSSEPPAANESIVKKSSSRRHKESRDSTEEKRTERHRSSRSSSAHSISGTSSSSGRRRRTHQKRRSSSKRDESPECTVCAEKERRRQSSASRTSVKDAVKQALPRHSSRRRHRRHHDDDEDNDDDDSEDDTVWFTDPSGSSWSPHVMPAKSIYRHVLPVSESETSDDDERCIWDSSDSEGEERRRDLAREKRIRNAARRHPAIPVRNLRSVRFAEFA